REPHCNLIRALRWRDDLHCLAVDEFSAYLLALGSELGVGATTLGSACRQHDEIARIGHATDLEDGRFHSAACFTVVCTYPSRSLHIRSTGSFQLNMAGCR